MKRIHRRTGRMRKRNRIRKRSASSQDPCVSCCVNATLPLVGAPGLPTFAVQYRAARGTILLKSRLPVRRYASLGGMIMQNVRVHSDPPGRGHNRPPMRPRLPGTAEISAAVPPVIIGRRSRSAMTSSSRSEPWTLEFDRVSAPAVEPLMGWTASDDPFSPIRLSFPTCASAIDFAERQGWDYIVIEPAVQRRRPHPDRDRVYRSRVAASALHTSRRSDRKPRQRR